MSLSEIPQPPPTGRGVENFLPAGAPRSADLSLPAEDERQLESVEMFVFRLPVLEPGLGQAGSRAAVLCVALTRHHRHLGPEDSSFGLPLLH